MVLAALGVEIDRSAVLSNGVFLGSLRLSMGPNAKVNFGAFLDGSAHIYLEEGVHLGPYTRVLTGSHEYALSELRRGKGSKDVQLSVRIGRGSWIGLGATILPGVVIAPGCVVAAGAVVTRSTEPNGLYAGVPAARIKDLAS
jgi:maltose O-acetyltransferase